MLNLETPWNSIDYYNFKSLATPETPKYIQISYFFNENFD